MQPNDSKFILIPLAVLVSSFIWFSWIAEP